MYSRLISFTPSGSWNVNARRRLVKKMNNSTRAICSPKHTRCPAEERETELVVYSKVLEKKLRTKFYWVPWILLMYDSYFPFTSVRTANAFGGWGNMYLIEQLYISNYISLLVWVLGIFCSYCTLPSQSINEVLPFHLCFLFCENHELLLS